MCLMQVEMNTNQAQVLLSVEMILGRQCRYVECSNQLGMTGR